MEFNNNFSFNIQISNDYITEKRMLEYVGAINHFSVKNLNVNEIVDAMKLGHSIQCIDDIKNKHLTYNCFSNDNSHFKMTNFVGIVIANSKYNLSDIIVRLFNKPTFANTIFSDKQQKSSFYLFYVFKEPITNANEYKKIWDIINISLRNTDDNIKLINESQNTTFLFTGNPSNNGIFYKSHIIYDKSDFKYD